MPWSKSHSVACVLMVALAMPAVSAGAPGRQPDARAMASDERYEAVLESVVRALVAGDAAAAEQQAAELIRLDDGRCEGYAALGAARARRGQLGPATVAFELARAKSDKSARGLVELLAATAMTADSGARGTVGPWCDVVEAEPDPRVVTDAHARASIANAGLPWKVSDRRTGIVMLLCPPGEFAMGSSESEKGHEYGEHRHQRSIRVAFYISESEVTQKQWSLVMPENPSTFRDDERPVDSVSWEQSQRFCRETGLRLPSEAEWEYACRAGSEGPHAGDLREIAWFVENSGKSSGRVRQKKPNAWGLYDMHGNVWEWVEDVHAPYPKGGGTEEAVVTGGTLHVQRGGGWLSAGADLRCAKRAGKAAQFSSGASGFRVARAPR